MNRIEDALGRTAAGLVRFSFTHVAMTLTLGLISTVVCLYLAATLLCVDTDSSRLLSVDMAAGQTNRLLVELFPALQDNVVVMIEADDAQDARDVALELRDRIAQLPDRYPEVFLPGYGDYYDDFGIYHLDRAELDELATRLNQSGELLATLNDRPELPILLAAISHVIASNDGLESLGPEGRRILEEVSLAVSAYEEGGHAPVDWDDLLFKEVDEGHTNPQLLFVKPIGDLTQLGPVLEAVRHLRSMASTLSPHPGLRVRVTGDRATHSEEMSLIIQEVGIAGAGSLVLVTLVLLYALRSFRLVLATVMTLLAGLAWTAGLAALAVGQLNALTSAFAVLYIGLGVDFGIHFALDYLERRDQGLPIADGLEKTGRTVGSSLFLCAITTAIGFYAFIPTDYRAVADMGIISGTSVFLGLLATLTVYPALIASGLGESRSRKSNFLQAIRINLPSFPLRYPRTVCVISLFLAVLCAGLARDVHFEFSTLKVRDPRVESVQALEDLLQNRDLSVWTMDIVADDVEQAAQLAERFSTVEGVEQVRSPIDFLPEDQVERLALFDQMRADLLTPVELTQEESGDALDRLEALKYTIEGYAVALDIDEELRGGAPEDDPLWDQAQALRTALIPLLSRIQDNTLTLTEIQSLELDLFSELDDVVTDMVEALPTRTVKLSELPDDLMARYIAPDGRARVEIFSTADLNQRGELERFNDTVQKIRPDAGGPVGGGVALGRAMVSSLREALVTAVVVISLGLLILLRSLRFTLITLAPLTLGSLATAAVSVLAHIPFNFANVIVLPLILGIGVDSGIHLVHRHREGLRHAENLLMTSTARAVLFSALTTLISFATLAFSNHLGISSLAKLLCVGISLMLIANVVLLPALLQWADGSSKESAQHSA
ncbi:MAG: MMPL family transporter [Myxococcota bacterium]|nr:MMPL family transporter [Myxococcota bacterium]